MLRKSIEIIVFDKPIISMDPLVIPMDPLVISMDPLEEICNSYETCSKPQTHYKAQYWVVKKPYLSLDILIIIFEMLTDVSKTRFACTNQYWKTYVGKSSFVPRSGFRTKLTHMITTIAPSDMVFIYAPFGDITFGTRNYKRIELQNMPHYQVHNDSESDQPYYCYEFYNGVGFEIPYCFITAEFWSYAQLGPNIYTMVRDNGPDNENIIDFIVAGTERKCNRNKIVSLLDKNTPVPIHTASVTGTLMGESYHIILCTTSLVF